MTQKSSQDVSVMLWFRRITWGNTQSASQSEEERQDKECMKEEKEGEQRARAGFPTDSFYATSAFLSVRFCPA